MEKKAMVNAIANKAEIPANTVSFDEAFREENPQTHAKKEKIVASTTLA